MAEMAFEEGEGLGGPAGAQGALAGEPVADRGGAAVEAGDGDVGHEGAGLRRQAGGLAGAFYLGTQRQERWGGGGAGPDRGGHAFAGEVAEAGELHRQGVQADGGEAGGEVVGLVGIHLAHEAQREVELLLILPPGPFERLHGIDQRITDGLGRAQGDEEAVHLVDETHARAWFHGVNDGVVDSRGAGRPACRRERECRTGFRGVEAGWREGERPVGCPVFRHPNLSCRPTSPPSPRRRLHRLEAL